jgi:hypothetical protein
VHVVSTGVAGVGLPYHDGHISTRYIVRPQLSTHDQDKRRLVVNQPLHLLYITLPASFRKTVVEPYLAVFDISEQGLVRGETRGGDEHVVAGGGHCRETHVESVRCTVDL